jgi:hypothetical protein
MILALNDTMFFGDHDFGGDFFAYYSTQPKRKYICIAAPSAVDLSHHKAVPCVVGGKFPKQAADGFHPSRWGYILVSSLADGALSAHRVVEYADKMPAYRDDAAGPRRDKARSALDDQPTFDYPALERALVVGEEIPAVAGDYALAVISGDMLSPFQRVTLTGAPGDSGVPTGETAAAPPVAIGADEYWFAHNPSSPPAPAAPGIALAADDGPARAGKPFMVYGSIRLDSAHETDSARPVDIHLLVSGTDEPDLSHYRIAIPADKLRRENDTWVAWFAFDCMKEFFYRQEERFDIPERFFVTAVRQDMSAGPLVVDTGS